MNRFTSKSIIRLMEFTLLALMFTQAYLNHKEEIDDSVARLKSALDKGERANEQQ